MRIGFDAKRAFYNRSGLGNYSRFIIQSLVKFQTENEYILYTPKTKNSINFLLSFPNICIATPVKLIHKLLSSYWRSIALANDIKNDEIEIFHGLSNELPKSIAKSDAKSVVTIHDLIFLRYPELYKAVDRKIYEKKFRFACENADIIIAISEQTKQDIIHYFNINSDKINVVYQSCDKRFQIEAEADLKSEIKEIYALPEEYLLYVGTIEKRKNLLSIVKAIHKGNISTPLVVVGRQTDYAEEVKTYIEEHKLSNIYFLINVPNAHLPAIFQMAKLFIYPSVFEGFGIPILEALYSKVPVITSEGSCFPEVGGPSSIYVKPDDFVEMAKQIKAILKDNNLREKMIKDGYEHAQNFSPEKVTKQLNNIYIQLADARRH